MKTATDNQRREPTSSRILVLLSLVMAWGVTGCGEPSVQDALSARGTQAASMVLADPCPTGTCTNPTNGRGIYISEMSNYCFLLPMEERYFCPEVFTSQGTGAVVLTGQTVFLGKDFPTTPDNVSYDMVAWFEGDRWSVSKIEANGMELSISIENASSSLTLSGVDVAQLVLEFPVQKPEFQLRFSIADEKSDPLFYRVEYQVIGTSVWQSYCQDEDGTAGFLPGKSVNSVTGRVTNSDHDVTMACRSGAIATCMAWGYRPWEADTAAKQEAADYLYGTCLQAKRAAFFVGWGDYNSYTVKGTSISIQDRDGIMRLPMPGVEAVWTPDGAICLSPEYRRIPPKGAGPMPALPSNISLPTCGPDLHAAAPGAMLPELLQEKAPLATGQPL